jgi:hypothetical protein
MTDTLNESVAQYDKPEDAGKPPKGIVTRWCKEIELAGRVEEAWRKKGKQVIKRFRDEEQLEKGAIKTRKLGVKFNILRPNTRVMKAAIYQDPPKPDVRRRFSDRDPLGKAVSEVTERALSFCMDKYDFDGAMQLAVNDMLLPGRGKTRVRYEPTTTPQMQGGQPVNDADGQPREQITWEKCCFKHVNWEDYRRGPGRIWSEVPWEAFRSRLTREEAIKEMPRAAKLLKTIDLDCQMDMTDEDERAVKENPALKDVFKRLTVWEVHDKLKREILFIAPSHKDEPLDVRADPLGIEDFFDGPRPLYAVEESDTLVPLEDFRAYADQAKELDNITARIDHIVSQLKIRGMYDATLKQMGDVMKASDGIMIPAEEVAALYNNGGIEKAIWLLPIEKIAGVLQYLYEHREQTKQIIYEITGLSDIMRGSSKASETATAQSIKAQNGAISIQDRRKSVKRYARDMVRIAAEIIGEHFQPDTLKAMTGLDFPTEQEKQQLGMQLQQMQMAMQQAAAMAQAQAVVAPAAGGPQTGSPVPPQGGQQGLPAATTPPQPAGPPPEMQQIQSRLQQPSWEEIIQVMRDDKMRSYRIDVETDETAFGDQAAEQQAISELLAAVTQFITGMAPLVQMGAVDAEFVKAMLLTAVRRFKVGREIEDAIEDMAERMASMPPAVDPNAGKMEAEAAKLEADKADKEQTRNFEREKFEDEKVARTQQSDRDREQFEFTKQQHTDELERRDRELGFTEKQHQDGIDQETGAEAMKAFGAEFPQQLQQSMQALTQVVQAMTAQTQQLQQMMAQSEQREGAVVQAMTQAIVTAMNTPKKVKRGKDGKITEVVPVAAKPNGAEARM